MSALEIHSSIDAQLRTARDAYEAELLSLKNRATELEMSREIAEVMMRKALAERDTWMRLATKYTTQFALVEKVFSDVKAAAIALATEEAEAALDAQSGETAVAPKGSVLPTVSPSGT